MASSGLINYRKWSLADCPSLTSKIAIVTGGNAGIGREIVAQLLKKDIEKVYVLARSKEHFSEAEMFWRNEHKIENVESRVEFLECTLSDMVTTKRVADGLVGRLERLDILINNAGLPTIPDYTLSPQGIETIWATNVIGTFVLTNILLPTLESTAEKYGDSRIVVTSSSFHMGCQELKLDLLKSPTRVKSPDAIDSCWRYARSKLGNLLFTKELAKRLEKRGSSKVYANCFFPGNIPTGAMDTWKELFGPLGYLMKANFWVLGQSTTDGAATALYLAAAPEVVERNQKGSYFCPVAAEDDTSALAKDKDLAKNVWYWCDGQVTDALGRGWDEQKGDGEGNGEGEEKAPSEEEKGGEIEILQSVEVIGAIPAS
ncbi:putative short chain dehydrogenase/reductase [Calycina marina]|uniref:Short chain dehydrogenase/reductase n=1 Tax=Calycina marina TaxID=1763456 RepID=A0A9P8CF02_9HELO|nr:putative short chain dehydrogenase/reductase [Calycina marina]